MWTLDTDEGRCSQDEVAVAQSGRDGDGTVRVGRIGFLGCWPKGGRWGAWTVGSQARAHVHFSPQFEPLPVATSLGVLNEFGPSLTSIFGCIGLIWGPNEELIFTTPYSNMAIDLICKSPIFLLFLRPSSSPLSHGPLQFKGIYVSIH